ncbi:HNH endonuclease [Frankia sp. AgB1.9]|uniref:HNH endonuclease n=1 Tax=unclassified Frankia TaxID=2632575 RepID=UPI0019335B65|nr:MULTISPECIES: HNH endonuclease [unclassified Frankia]MBL7491257.1 HNH endonuclease [Frankia sp. AgW1.1]MBL7547756.1 HNH endonuclease [Frankia sp. AgB1.9]MBL7621288.1 HNH endonuclease [Frankia sp. AgB1.8]
MPETTRSQLTWTRDEIILVCDAVSRRNWKSITGTDPEARALSDLLQRLPIYPHERRPQSFRNANGVAYKSVNLQTAHPSYRGGKTHGNKLDRVIVEEFIADPDRMHRLAVLIRITAESGEITSVPAEPDDDEDLSAPEGRLLVRQHLSRERSRELRAKKVQAVLNANGQLACQICSFDFEERYGERGRGYIECHHIVPLHEAGPGRTRLDDLILICANCHRMIHRASPWLSPDDLRTLIR